jgi:3-isopropylmalate/(R)-2-methylmalate dehydratase small subunit
MPCVAAGSDYLDTLRAALEADPRTEITIDLEGREIRFGGAAIPCEIREGARSALISGKWDPLQDLLDGAEAVAAVTGSLPYLSGK